MRTISAIVVLAAWVAFSGCSGVHEAPPTTLYDPRSLLADIHEQIDHLETLYCGCSYVRNGFGGEIAPDSCGLEVRRNEKRAGRVEWEHVVPVSWIGENRSCWTQGHELCTRDGETFKGRECCTRAGVDPGFLAAYNDSHNLFPTAGELNADRSNHPFGDVPGEPRQYGMCDFEVAGSPKVVEPAESVRGEVARAMLYMSDRYGIDVRMDLEELLEWHENDPPESWEIGRAVLIRIETGLENLYIPD